MKAEEAREKYRDSMKRAAIIRGWIDKDIDKQSETATRTFYEFKDCSEALKQEVIEGLRDDGFTVKTNKNEYSHGIDDQIEILWWENAFVMSHKETLIAFKKKYEKAIRAFEDIDFIKLTTVRSIGDFEDFKKIFEQTSKQFRKIFNDEGI